MRTERGSAGIELVLAFPVVVLGLLYIVFVGRVGTGRLEVDDAARIAARSASVVSPERAHEAAFDAALRTVTDRGLVCTGLDVVVHAENFEPGGSVGVSVTCDVRVSDLGLLGVPGTKRLTASFTEPISRYQAV